MKMLIIKLKRIEDAITCNNCCRLSHYIIKIKTRFQLFFLIMKGDGRPT